jgi:hypothetical protein
MTPSDNSSVEILKQSSVSMWECKPGITCSVRLLQKRRRVCVIRSEAPLSHMAILIRSSRTRSYSIHTARAGSHISPNISCCLSAAINSSSSRTWEIARSATQNLFLGNVSAHWTKLVHLSTTKSCSGFVLKMLHGEGFCEWESAIGSGLKVCHDQQIQF